MESQSWESSLQSRQPLVGPDVWRGADLPNLSGWRRILADSEIAELDAALRWKSLDLMGLQTYWPKCGMIWKMAAAS